MPTANGPIDSVASPEPAYYDWDGEHWYYNKKARYYYSRDGLLLHRAVWARAHGPLPAGHEVHHRDRDRSNNQLTNLELLTVSAHRSLTSRERTDPGWAEGRSERTSRGLTDYWKRRPPRDVVCAQCGVTYQSTGMRARFCGATCAARHHREEARKRRGL